MNKITFFVFLLLPFIVSSQILSENFEGAVGVNGLPTGWTETGLSTDGIWEIDNAANASSTYFSIDPHGNFVFTNDDSCNCDKSADRLITPTLDLSTMSTVELTYSVFLENNFEVVKIEVSTDGGNNWTSVATLTDVNGWRNAEKLDLSAYAGQNNVLISFLYNDQGSWAYGIGLDDITVDEIPTCVAPNNLLASNLTSSSAELSWNSNGTATAWNIEVVTLGTTPSGTATASNVTNPYVYNNLAANTGYEFYVQADCGAGDVSTWSGPYYFTTECDIFPLPFLQDFNASNFAPNCWEVASAGDPTSGPSNFGSGDWLQAYYLNNSSNSLSTKVNLYSVGTSSWLISPSINLSGASYNLKYMVGQTDYNDTVANENGGMSTTDDEVQVLITTDGGTTWQNITTYNSTNIAPLTGKQESFDLSAYSGIVQIAFWASEGANNDVADYDFFIDNVAVSQQENCINVSGITINNALPTSAGITWTENGAAAEWEILYGLTGFDPITSGTSIIDNDGTLGETLTGLTDDEDYDVYVRSICSESSISDWVGPETFSTTVLSVNNHLLNSISIYPNPTSNFLNIESSVLVDKICIYSLLGKKILENHPEKMSSSISLQGLQSGVYLVEIQKNNQTKVFKVIKE
ncbi:Por secretion system C-terminal sorting domain-containing protein [Mesonia phycicola]|uniref:Por secretion system C-terminal sorting domain-containing protein n=1 Tax=Mesonia phycicola TaxID=579105 RepID=A0A1M6FIZ7_9FLAO|nr:T9SS type A sorting domain-containing protein [Mesonia phycicola]SHI97677.1 Por secretion system C-terminal sorting domain-containing protein [Mesonia phycicola]